MTNQEAVDVISCIRNSDLPLYLAEKDALDMAIESLKNNVIRCKDCKKRGTLDCKFGIMTFNAPLADDYCSRAERREKNNEQFVW